MRVRNVGIIIATAIATASLPACDRQPSGESRSDAQPAGGHPGAVAAGPSLTTDVTKATGIQFAVRAKGPHRYFFPSIMAGGVALLDCDSDGDLDVLIVGGGEFPSRPESRPALKLYRNDGGWKFTDITAKSGLDIRQFLCGVAIGDVNNDGKPDVYLTAYGDDGLFLGRGDGTFEDVSKSSGISNPAWATSACFVDYDRDGRLDLYVANYVDYYPQRKCVDERGRHDFCGPQVFSGTTDKLFQNVTPPGSKSVKFEDVTATAGIAREKGPGLGVIARDFDGDGWPDLYVANDGTANFLWRNGKNGTFQNEAIPRGLAYSSLGKAQAGMGLATGDFQRDGRFGLLVTHLNGEMNALYLHSGRSWRDRIAATGMGPPGLRSTGFGVAIVDFNHDGRLDVAIANGDVRRTQSKPLAHTDVDNFVATYGQGNHLFVQNLPLRFDNAMSRDVFGLNDEVSRGLAAGDLDNDGDVDLVVVNFESPSRVYRNDAKKKGHWLGVRAVLPRRGGRNAFGAVVTLHCKNERFRADIAPNGSYQSSHDPRAHFGLGEIDKVDRIEVTWPDGTLEEFPATGVDRYLTLKRGAGRKR